VEMNSVERDSARAVALFAEMAERAIYPALTPIWKKLVKQRLGWRTRLKAQFSMHKM
jgi:hypothetical protein